MHSVYFADLYFSQKVGSLISMVSFFVCSFSSLRLSDSNHIIEFCCIWHKFLLFFSFSPKNLKDFTRHIYRLTQVFSEDSWKAMKSIQCIIREILDALVLTHFQSCQAMVNCWSEVYKMLGITLDFHSCKLTYRMCKLKKWNNNHQLLCSFQNCLLRLFWLRNCNFTGKNILSTYARGRFWKAWCINKSFRRKWQPTPVFLLRKYHEQRTLVGYSLWGHKSQIWLSN